MDHGRELLGRVNRNKDMKSPREAVDILRDDNSGQGLVKSPWPESEAGDSRGTALAGSSGALTKENI
jgi:hypothetical protein